MHEDVEFMSNLNAAIRERSRSESRLLLYVIVATSIWCVVWAREAMLDEVTHGMGKIVPSSKIQVVQNLEGGIVSEILIKAGDLVIRDQLLLKIDNRKSESSFEESVLRIQDLRIRSARLTAEVEGKPFVLPGDLAKQRPDLLKSEQSLHDSNRGLLENQLRITSLQIDQRRQEIEETRTRIRNLEEGLDLIRQQLDVTRPLVAKRIESQVELLKLEREASGIRERLESARTSVPRLASGIKELEQKMEDLRIAFRTRAQKELTDVVAEVGQLEHKQRALKDQVVRTLVKSPIKGIVKQVLVSTVGGVVKPGMDLVEIVPVEDNLLAEVRIRPSDIAFLRPGLHAVVKVTAYDYSIYGGLSGKLTGIGADTLNDEHGQTYYQVWVQTDKNYLGTSDKPLKIIPGMTVMVDILTGKKSVLQYILKPILRAKQNALTER